MSEKCIELGFLEKVDKWKLMSKYFPSKIGGFPAWLDLKNLPSSPSLTCHICKKPLVFLCQVYAPFNEKEECFHRTIYIFICRDPACCSENDASNIRVFRCQLGRKNEYYNYEPPKDAGDDSEESPTAACFNKICRICGALGSKVCGGCKKAQYCSKEHQACDWKAAHKTECKSPEMNTLPSVNNLLFLEFEIDLEPEELDECQEKTEGEIMKEYEELLRAGRAGTCDLASDSENDAAVMAAKNTDKQFQKFRTRIQKYPNQVIRYDRGGDPLYVSASNKPATIPSCSVCGEPRQFEFQVMPQLLVHLKVDSCGKSLDWGIILVYTCQNSCQGEMAYIEEVAFKQDYTPAADVFRNLPA